LSVFINESYTELLYRIRFTGNYIFISACARIADRFSVTGVSVCVHVTFFTNCAHLFCMVLK